MKSKQLSVLIATFSYGGNGGISSEVPNVRDWMLENVPKMQEDSRIHAVSRMEIADTPITMSRNRAVVEARKCGADLLLMIDSDMYPDLYLGKETWAEPFWDVAFNHCYRNWEKGPQVVAAPYGGPPPCENVYVFHWTNAASDHPDDLDHQLVQYSRHEAFSMAGIVPCAALPTGLILFDVRAFELTEPRKPGDHPWFYYEYVDLYESQKASTEDVTATRDISLAGLAKLGYNPLHCAWSSWAGHWKPKCVGRPQLLTPDMVSQTYRRAVLERLPSDRRSMAIHTAAACDGDWNQAVRLP